MALHPKLPTSVDAHETVGRRKASLTHKAPKAGGIYAWYYIPVETSVEQLIDRLSTMCMPSAQNTSRLRFDYGLRFESRGLVHASYGMQKDTRKAIQEGVSANPEAILHAFNTFMAPYFSRPIYIGISRNLRHRLYEEHYQTLLEYWEPTHSVSRFLNNSDTSNSQIREQVDQLQSTLGIPHSFALEARVRGLHPTDLEVFYAQTDWLLADGDSDSEEHRELRRSLERLLQLVSLPTFGRI